MHNDLDGPEIVSAVLAMLTGGCFATRTTPTSTGVLDRSLDPDLWPWPVAAVSSELSFRVGQGRRRHGPERDYGPSR